ncbi:hypothetical protein GCM10009098_07320 [Rheinheimera aquimaris]|uniref:Uncharacterized protein n=1 Tax=Rheinheimera aquimaris TaxID=412437 RepID=A0ABP3NDQ8_9GAMM|nr:hypothetical protein [Rheinheimera aquimaris]MCB5212094.1 hypothetical protein [Rheinheimera aquimaris]
MPVVFASLFAFLGALCTRLLQWFLANYLLGTVKSITIYVTLIAVVSLIVYNLVMWVNDTILEIINGLPPIAYANIMGVLAMMPKNLPYLATTIITYYILSIGAHITVEVAKFKARWAENSMSSFTKK